jgi:hypothetical protein
MTSDHTETFVCKDCGVQVFRFPAVGQPERTCAICDWINTNPNLTPEEREQLRDRLCKRDD